MPLPTPRYLLDRAAERDAAARAPFDASAQRFIAGEPAAPRIEPCPLAAGRRLAASLDSIREHFAGDDAVAGGRS